MGGRVIDLVGCHIDYGDFSCLFSLNDHFRNYKNTNQKWHQCHTGFQFINAHGHLELTGDNVFTNQTDHCTEQSRKNAFDNAVADNRTDNYKSHQINGKVFRRTELAGERSNIYRTENQYDFTEVVAVGRRDSGSF